MTDIGRWTHTVHLSGFIGEEGNDAFDAMRGTRASIHEGGIKTVAQGVLAEIERHGYAVATRHTWMLSGELIAVHATVTGSSPGSDIDVAMWHMFVQPSELYPMPGAAPQPPHLETHETRDEA